jgi:hypothetical protein
MIKLKDKESLSYSAFYVCEAEPCQEEATKIWATSESRIIDLCDLHYVEVSQ